MLINNQCVASSTCDTCNATGIQRIIILYLSWKDTLFGPEALSQLTVCIGPLEKIIQAYSVFRNGHENMSHC
jgi:hypothetical protein